VLPPAAVRAIRASSRIYAQQGVFVIFHRKITPMDDHLNNGSYLKRMIIPAKNKDNIIKELQLLGISNLTLFPELDNVAEKVRRRL
jgi:hypothetical protein